MDTRTKIVTLEEAGRLAASGARVVKGCFDPLLAGHAARLRALAGEGPLLVVVTSPEGALLEAGARAELVAGLAMVDYVVVGPVEFPGASIEEAGRAETRALIDRVKGRVAGVR